MSDKAGQDEGKPAKPVTGRTVLIYLLAFFGVMIVANAFYVYFGITSWPGTVTKSSYTASQTFNARLDEARQQLARGWSVDVSLDHDGTDGMISLTARDKTAAPLSGVAFTVRLHRPTNENEDHEVNLVEREAGHYVGTIGDLGRGIWLIEVEGRNAEEVQFLSEGRLDIE